MKKCRINFPALGSSYSGKANREIVLQFSITKQLEKIPIKITNSGYFYIPDFRYMLCIVYQKRLLLRNLLFQVMSTKLSPGGPFRLNPHPLPPPNNFRTNTGEVIPLQGSSNPLQAELCNPANFSYTVSEAGGVFSVTVTASMQMFISALLPQGAVVEDAVGEIPIVQMNVRQAGGGVGGNSLTINFPIATGDVAFVPWDASQGYELNIETRVRNGEAFTCNMLT